MLLLERPAPRRTHLRPPGGRARVSTEPCPPRGGAARPPRQHLIAPRNWEFLSPPREAVAQLTNTFGFSYVATPAGFDHVLGVTVVDAAGRIHAQVFGDRLRADQLGEPLRQLLLGTPPAATSTLAAVVERVRILCTVYDLSLIHISEPTRPY